MLFMALTGLLHSLSFISAPAGSNESEKQMIDLMIHYKMDMGAGMFRSFFQIHTALSACFTLLCFFGASLMWYLLRKGFPGDIRTGLLNIYSLIFGILFILMAFLTFLPPILCSAGIFIGLLTARLTLPPKS